MTHFTRGETHVRYYAYHKGANGAQVPGIWLRRGSNSVFIPHADIYAVADALVDLAEKYEKEIHVHI